MKSRDTLVRVQRFHVDEKRRQVADIEAMVADLKQKEADLEAQIEAEQTRTGIADVTHFAYSTFARSAMNRRDNIRETVEGLLPQLEEARDQLTDAAAELKRLELLGEREDARRRMDIAKAEQRALDEAGMQSFRG
jgi:flagellar export protein FliJ